MRHVLFGHDVMHVSGLSWKGKKDLRVLPDAKNAGFDALITKDRAQLNDPRECDAIKKADGITSATHSVWRECVAWRWP